ncbi:MAG: Fic family protein [Planctomycetota bacterium]
MPPPLPPGWEPDRETTLLLSQADMAVGRLSGLGQVIPNPHLLIRPYARREAVLSSKIEGTRSEYEDAVLFEIDPDGSKTGDADEVDNYIKAMDHGLACLDRLPLSGRLIREIHARLLASGRGQHRGPGRFRSNQVWIGPEGMGIEGATYVPPPVPQMKEAFDELERFLNQPTALPILIRLAMVHYQIEAIHPFEDGNGRIGRLLIVFMLCKEQVLTQPLLYLSAYFEKHRQTYYGLLLEVSTQGAWNDWIVFFLRGIIAQSNDAITRAIKLTELRDQYHRALHDAGVTSTIHQLVDQLFERPATRANLIAADFGVKHQTAMKYLRILEGHNMVEEITGRSRDMVFMARGVVHTTNAPLESL